MLAVLEIKWLHMNVWNMRLVTSIVLGLFFVQNLGLFGFETRLFGTGFILIFFVLQWRIALTKRVFFCLGSAKKTV